MMVLSLETRGIFKVQVGLASERTTVVQIPRCGPSTLHGDGSSNVDFDEKRQAQYTMKQAITVLCQCCWRRRVGRKGRKGRKGS
jgi:hypothetical protein